MSQHRYPRRFIEADGHKGKYFDDNAYAIEVIVEGGGSQCLLSHGLKGHCPYGEDLIDVCVEKGMFVELFDHFEPKQTDSPKVQFKPASISLLSAIKIQLTNCLSTEAANA